MMNIFRTSTATRHRSSTSRRWGIAAASIVVVGAGAGCATSDSGDNSPANDSPPVAVEAAKILKEFGANELKADAKYKGKNLKISGIVNKIDAEFLDEDQYILQLGGGGRYEVFTVNCNDMSTKELSKLDKGDEVTVIGEFDDGGDLGVEVKNCKIA